MTNNLSLYVIEDGLAELLLAREETLADLASMQGRPGPDHANDLAEAQNALATIEKTLREYMTLEVRKVDNYHRFFAVAENLVAEMKAEETKLSRRRARMTATIAWLKQSACDAMRAIGKKRIEGNAGRYLLLKGNGGMKPLVVDGWDAENEKWTVDKPVLPDDFHHAYVVLPLHAWHMVESEVLRTINTDYESVQITTKPANSKIRWAIAQGMTVPGARLAERGEHLECK